MKSPQKTFLGALLVLATAGLVFSAINTESDGKESMPPSISKCKITYEEREVRGASLTGVLDSGQTITIAFDFYDCAEIRKGDIVAYRHAGNADPVVKIVRGIPGDLFAIRKQEKNWGIFLNGKILKNSFGKPYILNEKTHKLLLGYEKSYNGIIPDNAFLLLGNLPSGTLDSTRSGLIDKSDILGKVI